MYKRNIPCETCPLKLFSGPVLPQQAAGQDESPMLSSCKLCELSAVVRTQMIFSNDEKDIYLVPVKHPLQYRALRRGLKTLVRWEYTEERISITGRAKVLDTRHTRIVGT